MSTNQAIDAGVQIRTQSETFRHTFDETIDITPEIEDETIFEEFRDLVDFDVITKQQQWLVSLRTGYFHERCLRHLEREFWNKFIKRSFDHLHKTICLLNTLDERI